MTEERRKPSDVALAESKAWRIGIVVARDMKDAFLRKRHNLLALGWPSGHALCQELDEGAAHWASREDQMMRDYLLHADENHIQL